MFDRIDAAVYHPIRGAVYFFRGSHYVKYVPGSGVQSYAGTRVRRIGIDGWRTLPNSFRSGLDAAFLHPNGHIYFFKGGSYVKYKAGEGVVPTGAGAVIRTIGVTGWKSFPQEFRSDLDAASFVPELGHAYFFKGDQYIKVKFDAQDVDSVVESNGSKIRKLGVTGWQELPKTFAEGVDAALYYRSNEFLYFFRGREYVRWEPDHGISRRYPRRIGQLHREHGGWPGLSTLLGGPFVGDVTATSASIWIWILGGRTTADLSVRLNGAAIAAPQFVEPVVGSSASDIAEGIEEVDAGGQVRLLKLTGLAAGTNQQIEFRRADDDTVIESIQFRTPPVGNVTGTITFGMGSCANSTEESAVDTFEAIAKSGLDFLLLGGDNCYYYNSAKSHTSRDSADPPHDWTKVGKMLQRQLEARNHPQFVPVARHVPTFSTWDDHDFGYNNCNGVRDNEDGRWVGRDRAAGVYRLMWNHPYRDDGNHIFYDFQWGPIHVFMTDGRFYGDRPYPNHQTQRLILGPNQTQWLINGLRTSDAPIRMVVFSSQFVPEAGGECFFNAAPEERTQILNAVDEHVDVPVLFLSGDIHLSECQRYPLNSNTPRILEVTSSPLKVKELKGPRAGNSNRLWQTTQNSFALIKVDYQGGAGVAVIGTITIEAIDADGAVLKNHGTNAPCRTVWNLMTRQLT